MRQHVGSDYIPLVIIGAARSGTKLLRDLLAQVPGFGTWDCDELPYVWRYGNARHPDDRLLPQHATASTRRYINGVFVRLARTRKLKVVVEKTCANSLRVEFVHAVVPDAKYVFIVRNGIDVVASAENRWTAPLDFPYLMRKARYVPVRDVPFYALRFAQNRIHKILSRQNRLRAWGPQVPEHQRLGSEASIWEIAANQWSRSVDLANQAFRSIGENRVCRVRYEDLVTDPEREVRRILNFLEMPEHAASAVDVSHVTAASVGKGSAVIPDDARRAIEPILQPLMSEFGYEWRSSRV